MVVLVLNAGSSSLKASAIEVDPEADDSGAWADAGTTIGRAEASWGSDASRQPDRAAGVRSVLASLARSGATPAEFTAVGHRVVHGGTRFTSATLIDAAVIDGIREAAQLAPLHNAVALETIRAARAEFSGVPHVAAFDTAYHATLAPDAFRYPVPEAWYRDWGVRRFGFHGLSVEWSVQRAAELLGRPVGELGLVVAHLGSGCSVTAVWQGASVDTSMGMTPLEGLMMGTRSGSIDPGMLVELLRVGRLDADAMDDALEHLSGLLGVSGLTGDFRDASEAAVAGHPRATLAIVMFIRRAAAAIGAAATALPRLDAVVFTGGIGENAAAARAEIVGRLAALRVAPLPAGAQPSSDALLSAPGQTPAVLRITAREDLVIAAQTVRLVSGPRAPSGTGPQPGS